METSKEALEKLYLAAKYYYQEKLLTVVDINNPNYFLEKLLDLDRLKFIVLRDLERSGKDRGNLENEQESKEEN